MTKIEYKGEIYETDERIFSTDDGAIFLPALKGSRHYLEPNSPEEIALRRHPLVASLNALETMEIVQRNNGRWAVFGDIHNDDDLAADYVGIGKNLQDAFHGLLTQVYKDMPELCVCKNPAEDARFN